MAGKSAHAYLCATPQACWWLMALVVVALVAAGCAGAYANPPNSFAAADLVGTWQAQYGRGNVDQIVLRGDGTFQQTYQDQSGYTYETRWNDWWLEPLLDGRIHVHLQGARYYLRGVEDAEMDGLLQLPADLTPGQLVPALPKGYVDIYGSGDVEMVGKLVLSVRATPTGELILHHMLRAGDDGFFIFRPSERLFRRVHD